MKRSPIALVTDSRDQQGSSRPRQASDSRSGAPALRRQPTRFTVDNVLRYASDIPSMQQRLPPHLQQRSNPNAAGGSARLADRSSVQVQTRLPPRTSKTSEKLVLLPEAESAESEKGDFDEGNEAAPERDDEAFRRRSGAQGKSYAERLTKARRAEKLARVTAYCTAQTFRLTETAVFLKDQHMARTKLYDDCLYVVYHLPLLPGTEGYRIRSSPVLKSPGGKIVLDEEMERSEARDYGEGFFDEEESDSRRFSVSADNEAGLRRRNVPPHQRRPSDTVESDATAFAEMYVFSYGVAVFWNFTANQERDILADLTFYMPSPTSAARKMPRLALVSAPLAEADFETEEFHFEYDHYAPRPRVFNDMITLRSGDHMIKLTMSHAIAQSTKLNHFEQQLTNMMEETAHIPRSLALTGKLGLKRVEVSRLLGALFKSRVDVNLSSNILDTPDFFWTSEPTLHPLYDSIREYLEITPRIKVLNERCRVFLDLAEILSDSLADTKMSNLNWVVIVLILLSIVVTITEVFLRFGLLEKSGKSGPGNGSALTAQYAHGQDTFAPVLISGTVRSFIGAIGKMRRGATGAPESCVCSVADL